MLFGLNFEKFPVFINLLKCSKRTDAPAEDKPKNLMRYILKHNNIFKFI